MVLRDTEFLTKRRVAKALQHATLQDMPLHDYIPRQSLATLLHHRVVALPSEHITYMVTGPRGSGKSVLVTKALLQDLASVVALELPPAPRMTDAMVVTALLAALNVKYTDRENLTTLVREVMAACQVLPIVMVEVNDRWTSAELEALRAVEGVGCRQKMSCIRLQNLPSEHVHKSIILTQRASGFQNYIINLVTLNFVL